MPDYWSSGYFRIFQSPVLIFNPCFKHLYSGLFSSLILGPLFDLLNISIIRATGPKHSVALFSSYCTCKIHANSLHRTGCRSVLWGWYPTSCMLLQSSREFLDYLQIWFWEPHLPVTYMRGQYWSPYEPKPAIHPQNYPDSLAFCTQL